MEGTVRFEVAGEKLQALSRIDEAVADLWEDILVLAEGLFELDGEAAMARWHHLLLAVGNFKRQGATKVRPPRLPSDNRAHQQREVLSIAGLALSEDDPDSWKLFQERTDGIGVASATSVLAALWPSSHAIMDVNALSAAVGVAIDAHGEGVPDWLPAASSCARVRVDWNKYGWYRESLGATAKHYDIEIVLLERALYNAFRAVPKAQDKGRTWADFGKLLREQLT